LRGVEKQVTSDELKQIVETREPKGCYWAIDSDGRFVGVDNTHGHAFTEDFDNIGDCIAWLRSTETKEDMFEQA
jgi:hypothetical protein